jgi:hydrogenase nickel incorporation protein HypA/HybF
MHEGAIVKSLLDIAKQSFMESDLNEVNKVKVIIGKFHNIVNDVMQMHFDLMKKEIAGFEQAVLEIEEKDLVIRCRNCHKTTGVGDTYFYCPDCGSADTDLVQGDELYIAAIEGMDNAK